MCSSGESERKSGCAPMKCMPSSCEAMSEMFVKCFQGNDEGSEWGRMMKGMMGSCCGSTARDTAKTSGKEVSK